MTPSPYTDLKSNLLLGQDVKGFACIQCKGPPSTFVAMALRGDATDAKPAILVAYALCSRCGAQYWEEAGAKVFAFLRESLVE